MEGESFQDNIDYGSEDTFWETRSELEGFSGNGYVEAVEIERDTFSSRYYRIAPELRYPIRFETAGQYRVWMRGYSVSTRADSVHVNLNEVPRSSRDAQEFFIDKTQLLWTGNNRRDEPQLVSVPAPGVHFLSMWIRESAQVVDKIILSLDHDYTPEGEGPGESDSEAIDGGDRRFIRSDSNGNGRLEISDAVSILLHLFSGERYVTCDDHGDFDDNGRLDINDAIASLNHLFRRGPPPAPPFPEPGFDTTLDGVECGEP